MSICLSAKYPSSFILHFATFKLFSLFYLLYWVWMNIANVKVKMTLIWITLEIINLWNSLHNIRNSLRQKYILFIDFICSNTKYQIHLAEVIITVLPVTPILHTVFCQHPKLFSSLTLKISISFLFSIWKNIFIDGQIFLIFTESFNLSPFKGLFQRWIYLK